MTRFAIMMSLVGLAACERAITAPLEEQQPPPGPRPIDMPGDAAVPTLDAATAPTSSALREVTEILAGRGRVDRFRRQSAMAPDPAWDVHRIEMIEFRQTGRSVQITGTARTADDVIQLAKRIGLDPLFDNVAIVAGRGSASRFTIVMEAPADDPATALVIRP